MPEKRSMTISMRLECQRIAFDDDRGDEVLLGHDVLLRHLTKCEAPVLGGSTQKTTMHFTLSRPVQGLKVVQKTYRGEHIGPFTKVVAMGNFPAGTHQFTFEPDKVPDGFLERGLYKSIVEYYCSGDGDNDNNSSTQLLLSYTSRFRIVKKQQFQSLKCHCSTVLSQQHKLRCDTDRTVLMNSFSSSIQDYE